VTPARQAADDAFEVARLSQVVNEKQNPHAAGWMPRMLPE
jgi:hypothetical protein